MKHAKITYKNWRGKSCEFHPADTYHTLGTERAARNIEIWKAQIEKAHKLRRPRWLRSAKLEIVDDESGTARSIR